MADYKEMYLALFRKMTKAISLLQEAQQDAEEIYMSSREPNIRVLTPDPESIPDKTDELDDT